MTVELSGSVNRGIGPRIWLECNELQVARCNVEVGLIVAHIRLAHVAPDFHVPGPGKRSTCDEPLNQTSIRVPELEYHLFLKHCETIAHTLKYVKESSRRNDHF